MKTLVLLLAILGLTIYNLQGSNSLSTGFLQKDTTQTETQYLQFQQWKELHNKIYDSVDEDQYRFEIYLQNLQYVLKRNQQEGYEMLGMNNLADLSQQEYRERHLISKEYTEKINKNEKDVEYVQVADVPDQVDWVSKGAVPPVVDQRNCAASYAIASAAALSASYQINQGDLIPMSAQQIVSCDTSSGACRGGSDYYAYLYVMQNGIEGADSYPYTGNGSKCAFDSSNVVYTPKDALRIHYNDVAVIEQNLANQPLTAWVDADCQDFQLYRGGDKVFTGNFCQNDELNYIVLLAGYNNTAEKPYYLVQASYGTRWGNDGYMYMEKKTKGSGPLGVNNRVSFPGYNRYK